MALWGRVESVTSGDGALRVVMSVDRWLVPAAGGAAHTFTADDPVTSVGAPSWAVGDEGLLVIPAAGPASLTRDGHDLEQAWRSAGGDRPRDCPH
ncbi:hypothetical protein [Asanoa sp. NPDC050611]|uniref:hypothetical protein n=1 Tax=Asanoa sp. NPDC050611 TaxID=3157098 RepID=UPI0033FAA297